MSIEKNAFKSVLGAIGNTPIVDLNSIAPDLSVNLYGKCEFLNPGGSIKDRIALYMVDQAEKEGLLREGGTIIEATSGNTGIGLAITAAIRGYRSIFVMADKQSKEKQQMLQVLGAKVVLCPTDVEPEDERSYYKVAEKLAKEIPNSFYTSQYTNQDNPKAHYCITGPEIYEQCGDSLDFLIAGMGTGGTISGLSKYLKEKKSSVKSIGVDPVGSIYYDLFHKGVIGKAEPYLVEGIGEDFLPSTIDMKSMDDVVQVTDKESLLMARRLVRKTGLLVGGSAGAAVIGAIKYFQQNPKSTDGGKKNALIILVDSSSRYLSKHLNDEWMSNSVN